MTTVALILGPLAALIGVWLGGVLARRTQREGWQRDHDRQERESVRRACSAYVAAARRFTAHVKDVNTEITVVPNPEWGEPIHVVKDPTFHLELETASADVLLVVRTVETVQCARNLRNALNALALARADRPGAALPLERLAEIRSAEIAFINAARAELGAPGLTVGLYRLDSLPNGGIADLASDAPQ